MLESELVTERKNFIFNRNEHTSELQERKRGRVGIKKKKEKKGKQKKRRKEKAKERPGKSSNQKRGNGRRGDKEFAAKLQSWSLYYLVTG